MIGIYLFVSAITLGCLFWLIYAQRKLTKKVEVYVSYIANKNDEMEKNINTLGRVMKIYEDATQILKRKNEVAQLQERFTRTPR
jgi:hypothetical protein